MFVIVFGQKWVGVDHIQEVVVAVVVVVTAAVEADADVGDAVAVEATVATSTEPECMLETFQCRVQLLNLKKLLKNLDRLLKFGKLILFRASHLLCFGIRMMLKMLSVASTDSTNSVFI